MFITTEGHRSDSLFYDLLKREYELERAWTEIPAPIVIPREWLDRQPNIKQVYFNEIKKTTVVVWDDGTKTKVTCSENDIWSEEKGLMACYLKKQFGKDFFRKALMPSLENAHRICKPEVVEEDWD